MQVRAAQELHGPNEVSSALKVPAWVRLTKSMFAGSALVLWAGMILCFVNYSIEVSGVINLCQNFKMGYHGA